MLFNVYNIGMCAASQLPGMGPIVVDDAHAPHVNQKEMMMMVTRKSLILPAAQNYKFMQTSVC